ncbi:hypothetical protein SmJEL517_g03420 [Synchytrium microbalum]|uniref:Meiotic nuclear division protein 1 n=1 Tax=Synchytrium microbalum TaxID=1806994 RepID=A0A507C2Q5_9FUNG|nr:uncharacterized protein SmJEL517_g03420 [Synchytrium microbalum]TPX33711.1 hypothetical protein SmJEL517_g03420 [Synchytrium microbalum]
MASKKKLSFDDKRRKLQELFFETKDFWSLKEIEKKASKEKGIVMQTVKEVLDSLVSDNLVTTDKIGTSNYYWAFPSTALQARKNKLNDLEAELNAIRARNSDIMALVEKAKYGREESESRANLLQELLAAETLRSDNLAELQAYKDSDPVLLEAKAKAATNAKNAANRWTENMFMLQSYCSNNFNLDPRDFASQFGLPEEFDTFA